MGHVTLGKERRRWQPLLTAPALPPKLISGLGGCPYRSPLFPTTKAFTIHQPQGTSVGVEDSRNHARKQELDTGFSAATEHYVQKTARGAVNF